MGTTVKLLVPAAYAQCGVGAGRRCGSPRICGGGAPSNGMEDPTLPLWRPAVVHRRTPFVVKRPVYEADCEPAMRCYPALCRERCVQSSLPCVGRVDGRVNASCPRPGTQRYFPETLFAKEDKRRFDCGGNHLGCPERGRRKDCSAD